MRAVVVVIVMSALLLIGVETWIALPSDPPVILLLKPTAYRLAVPPVLLPLLGFLVAIAAAALLVARIVVRPKPPTAATRAAATSAHAAAASLLATPADADATAAAVRATRPDPLVRWSVGFGAVAGAACLLAGVAVATKQLPAAQGCALLICGLVSAIAALYALAALGRGEAVEFSSYWGGLGGASGGWRLSPPTTIVLLALIFFSSTVMLALAGAHAGAKDVYATTNSTANSEDGDASPPASPAPKAKPAPSAGEKLGETKPDAGK